MTTYRVLYITKFYPPFTTAASFRALEITKGLVGKGFEFIVVTGSKNPIFRDPSLIQKIPPNVTVFPVDMDRFMGYPDFIRKLGRLLGNNFDIIYTTGPPFNTFIMGVLLKRLKNKPLIVEYRDPWLNNPYHPRPKYLEKFLYFLEHYILKRADAVVCVSNPLKYRLISSHNINPQKIFVVQNAFENGIPQLYSARRGTFPKDKLVLVLTATIYGRRNPLPFFRLIKKMRDKGFINKDNFVFHIYGGYPAVLENYLKKMRLDDIIVLHGAVPRDVCASAQLSSSLLVDISERDFDYPTFPYHFWEYFASGRKILYLGKEKSFKSDFLLKNKLGIILPLDNPAVMEENFVKVLEEFRKGKREFYNNLTPRFLTENIWNKRIDMLEHIIRIIVKNRKK